MTKIIQITDLHLDVAGEKPFDIDVRANFMKLLDAALKLKPDHLVLTGDLCYRDADETIYQWLYEQMQQQPIPYDIIAGNHDESVMMANVFDRSAFLVDKELFFAKKIGKQSCVFLDSAVGSHSTEQLKWLERQLRQASGPLIIFMHHPPVLADVPFMDIKYPLQDIEAVQQILTSYEDNITVFCGHYHVEKTIRFKNVLVQITPSCFFQIDQQSEEFKVDHHQVAFRLIEVSGEMIKSTVRYFAGSR